MLAVAVRSVTTAVVVLGAGWSRLAGRPLVGELFEGMPFAASAESQRRHGRVHDAWRLWSEQHGSAFVEEFLSASVGTALWPYVVRYVGARLAEPDQVRLANELRYGERLDKPSPSEIHHQFIEAILRRSELVGVVTTNYDLLAEGTLRHRQMQRPVKPGFFYAGIDGGRVQGASTFSVRRRWIDITGSVPLCKLHGSLNWYLPASGIVALADCRPAFRSRDVSHIVAPVPEKNVPAALDEVWSEARSLLTAAEEWVVVGYSAPVYDTAIANLFSTAATGALRRVRVVDPNEALVERYQALSARDVEWYESLEKFCRRLEGGEIEPSELALWGRPAEPWRDPKRPAHNSVVRSSVPAPATTTAGRARTSCMCTGRRPAVSRSGLRRRCEFLGQISRGLINAAYACPVQGGAVRAAVTSRFARTHVVETPLHRAAQGMRTQRPDQVRSRGSSR